MHLKYEYDISLVSRLSARWRAWAWRTRSARSMMLLELAVLEVVGKVPSCHLLTKGLARSQEVVDDLEIEGKGVF